jgi:cyclophilin family peptidyl-prolyl cis-trans isomerase
VLVSAVAAAALLACAGRHAAGTVVARPTPPAPVPPGLTHLEERALLLLLVDRQIFEPYTVEQSLLGDAGLREELALALGRIPDARAGQALRALIDDREPTVRRAAAFALGLHAESAAELRPALLRAVRDADRQVGTLAVEALARLTTPLADVQGGLDPLAVPERWARLLPSLFRFQEDATVEVARAALVPGAVADADLHADAAYALARYPRPAGAPLLRELLADPNPWVSAWAARGLGQVGEGADVILLRPLLDASATGPVVQALRAAARLGREGKTAAPASWRRPLLALLADARPGVRVTALEVAGSWLGDEALASALVARFHSGPLRERQLALLALVAGGDARAADLVAEAAHAGEAPLRAAAAEGAGKVPLPTVLESLASDPAPPVRGAALTARLGLAGEAGEPIARAALGDADPVVRSGALDWLVEHPRLPAAELVTALHHAAGDSLDDAQRSAIAALEARAKAMPAEREPILAALRDVVAGQSWLLRRAASEAITALGEPLPAIGEAGRQLPVAAYRDLLLASQQPHRVRLETERGPVDIELACAQAPLTCNNFLSLAGQGFYDGTVFHRVVPDFVVQGGDPRGDGSGGPGWSIRDELNPLRYERGVVGMALSGPDTGGSQFFVTLSPQPHLDGGYTVFGRVVAGMEVLDGLEQWDRLVRVRETPR